MWKEYRNLQDDLVDIYKKQTTSIREIAGVNKSIEKGLLERHRREKELIQLIRDSKENLLNAEKKAVTVRGKDKDAAMANVAARKQALIALQAEYDMLQKINKQVMIPWIYFMVKTWTLFMRMDKAAEALRMTMGVFRGQVADIRSQAQKMAIQFMNVGVTIDGVYNALVALGKEMGSIRIASTALVQTIALLKAQLGVAEEDSAGFFRNMAALSKTTMASQENMAYLAQDLSQAAGVPLPTIMSDIAHMSEKTLSLMSRVPSQIVKAAVEARRLNVSLNEMARGNEQLLNFTENIQAEMEASVLLGKAINLQKARELTYHRNIIEATKEIVGIAEKIDFTNLDYFQQQAFARATGRSVEELFKMVQAQKEWNEARLSNDLIVKKSVAEYDRLLRMNKEETSDRAQHIKQMVIQQANQQRIITIQNKWNKIVAQLGEIFLPIIDKLLSAVTYVIDIGTGVARFAINLYGAFYAIEKIFKYSGNISVIFHNLGLKIKLLNFIFKPLKSLFGYIMVATDKILPTLIRIVGVGSKFPKIFGIIAPLLKTFGKFTGIINILLAVWNVVKSIFHGIIDIIDGIKIMFNGNVWGGILKVFHGLFKATIGAILGAIEGVFGFIIDIPILILKGLGAMGVGWAKAAGEWANSMWTALKDWFGFSPSKIALLILKGITSIGTMMFDALTYPFRHAFAWILDKIPGMGKFAGKLREGMGGVLAEPVEKKATAAYIPAVTVTPTGTRIATPEPAKTAVTAETKAESTSDSKTLGEILAALTTLNKNLEAGKIGFYVDGQLLSATLARQTEFRKGYGVNSIA
jgi:hypothetical protein